MSNKASTVTGGKEGVFLKNRKEHFSRKGRRVRDERGKNVPTEIEGTCQIDKKERSWRERRNVPCKNEGASQGHQKRKERSSRKETGARTYKRKCIRGNRVEASVMAEREVLRRKGRTGLDLHWRNTPPCAAQQAVRKAKHDAVLWRMGGSIAHDGRRK